MSYRHTKKIKPTLDNVANIDVLIKDKVVKSVPVYASKEVEKVSFFKSLFMSINYLIWGDV